MEAVEPEVYTVREWGVLGSLGAFCALHRDSGDNSSPLQLCYTQLTAGTHIL